MLLSDKYPFLTNYFTLALSQTNRALPQSILFYGNDLDSQYKLATEIARLLNCKEDKSDDCSCLNCRWINSHTHPAVMTISKADNKPENDSSKTVISIRQAHMIKELLVTDSEYHRVFIFCDRDSDGNIQGINPLNFQEETANSLLKIIEEPQPRVTFIFLTKYIDDVLSTIISRSQCFFVPSFKHTDYDYSCIDGIFTEYYEYERDKVFDISQNLQELLKNYNIEKILDSIQNYMLALLKSNPSQINIIKDIKLIEDAKNQARLGMRPANIFDDLCLKLIGKTC